MVGLTKEQEDFLQECETNFADRYTEKDADYIKIFNSEPKKPPIMDPWAEKRDGFRQGNRHRNNRDHNRRFNRHRYDDRSNYRDYNRYRDTRYY